MTPRGPGADRRPGVDADRDDLGFGKVVSQTRGVRFLNPDGSFNVERRGLHLLPSLSLYYSLLSMRWWAFFALLGCVYLVLNLGFALAYLACGPAALAGAADDGVRRLGDAFAFSVQTFATIGYGHLVPVGAAANTLVVVEAAVGLLSVALATGLVFAKISRPTTDVLFSRTAVVAPYGDGTGLMFRIVNERRSQLIDVRARVILARFVDEPGGRRRRFAELPLEREEVMFFPLSWTVVHPIDRASPLWGLDAQALAEAEAEVLVLLTATDDTFSQTVHARSSYGPAEIAFGRRFASLYLPRRGGRVAIDVRRLHDTESATAPR